MSSRELDLQRKAVDSARADLRRAAVAAQDAQDALANAQRSGRPDSAKVAAAKKEVRRATETRDRAARDMASAVERLGPLIVTHLPPTPEQEVASLEADRPIVMLPIRPETRFVGNELLLRVYPDDIFADSHEPELTDAEIEDGHRFWETGWPDETAERQAWRALVNAVGAPRAVWVADQTQPTNLAERPANPPVFPNVARRESAWTRAAHARLLPDRWIVALYRAGAPVRIEASTRPVREPLALTMSPDPAEPRSALSDDGLDADDASRWTVVFSAAEEAGMGMRIPLSAEERATGFERVVVLGVKSTLAPDASAEALRQLFDAHRYGRGMAFVPQGTPTNNTTAAPSPFPPPDRDGSGSFASARRTVAPVDGRDGGRLMGALGLPATTAEHWAAADGCSNDMAGAMARALWPTTLRYFVEQMMSPTFDDVDLSVGQRFFVEHVRGRGPFAAFRIGNTPYGVLPVSSLERWTAEKADDTLDRELPQILRHLLPVWTSQIGAVPRVGRSADPDADLIAILGMEASTREARLRAVIGEDVQWNTFGITDWLPQWGAWWDYEQELTKLILQAIGLPPWDTRIGRVNFSDTAWPFLYGLVSEDPVAETATLSPNYIDWIANAAVPELMGQQFPSAWTRPPRSLLYRLLRHAALLEYHDASFTLLRRYEMADDSVRREPELVGLPEQGNRPNRTQRMFQKIPPLTGAQTLHTFLANRANATTLRTLLPEKQVVGLRDALAVLAPLSTSELDRLCTETLDVVSHRIDAWITALASKRLAKMRATQATGCHLGAYGWIENLVPRTPAGALEVGDGTLAERQSGNGGYIQAPSMTHAAAAAVLRNAYLSRSGPGQEQYAVDLSSARVRTGRFVLDAVREGQPLGAVLGYQVERGLHDRLQDVAIDGLRRVFPLVAGKSNDPADANEPQEQIAARNVVDGLALRNAYREGRLTAALLGLPDGGPAWAAVLAEVVKLDMVVDSTADLLLGESIYQLVKGSPTAAAATLDAMAHGGVRPPDPEIATMPRRGTPLTHRVAVVLGDGPSPLPAGWPALPTPRAELEPWIDAWVGSLFGDPTEVTCEVELGPVDGPTATTTVSLDLLDLRPVDVLALARALGDAERGATQSGASELDRRVRDAAYDKENITAEVETRIRYGRTAGFDPLTQRTFADLLELARSVEQLLRHSRHLQPADLVAEDRGDDANAANLLADDALTRADDTCTRLDEALDALDPAVADAFAAPAGDPFDLTALRNALRRLALLGAPAAYPVNSLGHTPALRAPLVAQAQSLLLDGRDRLARATAMVDEAADPSHDADQTYRRKAAIEAVALALGTATPFIPRFKLRPADAPQAGPVETELANALGYSTDAAFVGADDKARDSAITKFEVIASRVRPPLDAWRRFELVGGMLQCPRAPRAVVQLPFESGAAWAALPFADEDHRPKPGRVSMLLLRVAQPTASDTWAGLLLDQWVEQIPLPIERTAIAFHYDDPGAEAPQTILLAVPPARTGHWDLDSLLAILNETLQLAKVRAVDGELLGLLGQLLPMIYLSDSTDDVTIRTEFTDAVRAEYTIGTLVEG